MERYLYDLGEIDVDLLEKQISFVWVKLPHGEMTKEEQSMVDGLFNLLRVLEIQASHRKD